MKAALLLLPALLLAACGQREALRPAPGQSLPVAPLGETAAPTATELLEQPVIARPQRTEEVLTRSQERESDRFDLPPT